MRSRIFLKLFLAALLIIAACTLTLYVLIEHAWEGMLRSEIETSLRQKTLMFASRVENSPPASLGEITMQAARAADARVTVIDSTGKVLADSEADPAKMENHATRPEFVSALQGQVGSSTRVSHTHRDGTALRGRADSWRRGAHGLSAVRDSPGQSAHSSRLA